ncbi:hypothetical protein BRM22_23770 [Xanthomonas oryzae pv. oryzae]|uniref:hypothetical protein n=1 Tax=Xanthomonas oryzae TaxID=347 RepID=UPI00041C6276|nr:hypothetical protein [Xanthomonas oryzae]AJQ85412.1 hypothetical protein AZ54_05335 [Xanthomonas oryzae pv. oryzae PXO86]ALZ70953.1 hypothetical protein APZ20_04930 [Xanthomonas oryzae pv. oryzae]AOS03694.1 hypothetical protein ATY42_18165 [Xanthomonas oryzae pv. oryzae]AOS07042.1 hypothetical protein ATY43_14395 [Xanthomonas oryzae pv. oryzae]AOS20328.1 hypothetical protein ATY46_18440 [Xanthomonas oryzae pv. oryzae]
MHCNGITRSINVIDDPQYSACMSSQRSGLQQPRRYGLAGFQTSAALALINRLPHGTLRRTP